MSVCARLSAGVQVCVRAALGCVDALQSSGIVPIVEKVRGLIKNVWSPDISHRPTAASRDGRDSESSSVMGCGGVGRGCIHTCAVLSLHLYFLQWWMCGKFPFELRNSQDFDS